MRTPASIPEDAGYVVSMVEHQGDIFIACQFAVYRLRARIMELETVLTVPHPPIIADREVLE